MRSYLDFEKPVAELEAKVSELHQLAAKGDAVAIGEELSRLADTLEELNRYKPLVTFDNLEEIHKIKRHAPHAGLVLRLKVPNTGAMVELSSKFGASPGEAVDLILEADKVGLTVEGISFHVGSQCTNFQNFVQALEISSAIMREAKSRGREIKILDIGMGRALFDEGTPGVHRVGPGVFRIDTGPQERQARLMEHTAEMHTVKRLSRSTSDRSDAFPE